MRRWTVLAAAMVAQIATTLFGNAPAFLIPYLHLERGLSLARAGSLAAAPLLGTLVSLVAWGALVDRVGERLCLVVGLVVVVVASLGAWRADGYGWLALAWFAGGVGVASSNSASGRLVIGWFPPDQRGTAMGIRQTALPLGVGLAALVVPALVSRHGVALTMLMIAAVAAVSAVIVWIVVADPPRTSRSAAEDDVTANPYRGDRRLARIHLASVLLVVPQFTVWTFMLVWLIDGRGWSAWSAGLLVGLTQLLGAASRIGAGWWSDRVGSRLGPLRIVAIMAALTMATLGLTQQSPVGVVAMVVATAVTVADNGLAFTAVAEIAGPRWAGRAMGLQNTGQYLAASAVPPVVGAAVTAAGYGWAFGLAAVFPLLAIPMVPLDRVTAPRRPSPQR